MVADTAEKVRGLRSYASHLRVARAAKHDERLAESLAKAIRGYMPRAGWASTKGDGSEDYEEAEAAYRRDTEQEAPIFKTAKLRVQDNWYMWDEVRGPLRNALELHLPYGKRSPGAQWLEVLLHGDELDDYVLFRAREKLLELHKSIKPFN